MITVSEKAKNQIIKLMNDDGMSPETHFLRVGVGGSGCAGLAYKMSFDEKLDQQLDEKYEDGGITIVCDKKSLLYLWGTELNYSDGLNGKGFEFLNPNASRTCSCGDSFAVQHNHFV